MIMTLAKTYGAFVAYAIVFSAADGMMVTTFIIECFNSVEESKRASAFGFTLISTGVFATGSPPLSGMFSAIVFTPALTSPCLESGQNKEKNLKFHFFLLSQNSKIKTALAVLRYTLCEQGLFSIFLENCDFSRS